MSKSQGGSKGLASPFPGYHLQPRCDLRRLAIGPSGLPRVRGESHRKGRTIVWRKVLRRTLARKRRGALTIMAIPAADGSVRAITIPLISIYVGSVLVVAVAAFLLFSYFGMTATVARFYRENLLKDAHIQKLAEDNQELERSNAANEKKIAEFAERTAKLEEQLSRLDATSKEIMGIIKGQRTATTGTSIASRGGLERGTAPGTARGESAATNPTPDEEALAERTEARLDELATAADGLATELTALRRGALSYRDKLDHTPSGWPVRGRITSSFGSRSHPITSQVQPHEGVDIAAAIGTAIRATADGVVEFSGTRVGYGRVVVIAHGYGFETVYAHNSRNLVAAGQRVKRGQIIAYLGNSGTSTGPHVHYEVRVSGRPVNPQRYMG